MNRIALNCTLLNNLIFHKTFYSWCHPLNSLSLNYKRKNWTSFCTCKMSVFFIEKKNIFFSSFFTCKMSACFIFFAFINVFCITSTVLLLCFLSSYDNYLAIFHFICIFLHFIVILLILRRQKKLLRSLKRWKVR